MDKEKASQPSMRMSILDEKHKIKKIPPNGDNNSNMNAHTLNYINSSNINMTLQNISNKQMQSMISSLKHFENDKKNNPTVNKVDDNSLGDISLITKKENFVINNIDNSMFNELDQSYAKQVKYTVHREVPLPDSNHELSEFFKSKIENANANEEIILPDTKLTMNMLIISKPIKIKGQIGSCLEITEGPILIDISDNVENDSVKISQLRILFNDNDLYSELTGQNKSTSILFKLYHGCILELEDCDVIHQVASSDKSMYISQVNVDYRIRKTKSVAFQLRPDGTGNPSLQSTVLTITNSRISSFYQTLQSRDNCILNIEKSCISNNYGKSIIMLNPLIIKISETTFERNGYDAIHIKFIKEDQSIDQNRKFYFNKNVIEYNMGCALCLEGIKDHQMNLSIAMTDNTFRYNNSDGVLVWDLSYVSFEVSKNSFVKNNGNGLNIQKVTQNKSLSSEPIKLTSNSFCKNYGFGLLVNGSQVDASSNAFNANRASGLILCNLILTNPKTGVKVTNSDSVTGVVSSEGSGSDLTSKSIVTLTNNNFQENGESGLKLINYNFPVKAEENIFRENCEHGIFVDLDYRNTSSTNSNTWTSTMSERIKTFSAVESTTAKSSANIILSRCIIEKNLKSGISMCNCFMFCEDSYIMDNISYAIYLPKKEFQFCFRESKTKNKKNTINGSIGGEWGEINLNSKTPCSISCTSEETKRNKKTQLEKEIDKMNPNNVNSLNDININIREPKGDFSDSDEDSHKNNKSDKDDGCRVV